MSTVDPQRGATPGRPSSGGRRPSVATAKARASGLALAFLAASLVATCGPGDPAASEADASSPPPHQTLAVQVVANGSFELVADDTTTPPKFGAYWVGAFEPGEGAPGDRIEERDDAADGRRVLSLEPGAPVRQKIVADPRWTDALTVSLMVRGPADGRLGVSLEDGTGRVMARTLGVGPSWQRHDLDLGAALAALTGGPPVPRLVLGMEALAGSGPIEVDAVSATLPGPRVQPGELVDAVRALVVWGLETFYLPPAEGGLGLVDTATGYVLRDGVHVETGEGGRRNRSVAFHTVHNILIRWLTVARQQGWDDQVLRWTPELERIVATLLTRHLHPETGLPRMVSGETGEPLDDTPVTVGAFVKFLVQARPLLDDAALREGCVTAVRRMADTLLALQAEHDQDPARVFNVAKLDPATGVFEGTYPNWYGHMPNRLTPTGRLDTPRRYNTAWAIVKRRSFWYHLFKSPTAVMMAHALDPRPGDLAGVARALSLYERDWDAARYDLENDTDDHYGYLTEDLVDLLRASLEVEPRTDGLRAVQALALEHLAVATDHRLEPDADDAGDTLWIQAVRLGTACAGDSPRAFKGVLDQLELPVDLGALNGERALYEAAITELAANDYKGRQVTNAQFTESFFKHWEMVCICFHGTYQGDCRERPMSEWQGDVGDIFGGPPISSINAQTWALAVARSDAARAQILSRLETIRHVSDQALRRRHGYLYGLDPEVARQYGLPDKYTTGLNPNTAAGLGTVSAWLEALPTLLELSRD